MTEIPCYICHCKLNFCKCVRFCMFKVLLYYLQCYLLLGPGPSSDCLTLSRVWSVAIKIFVFFILWSVRVYRNYRGKSGPQKTVWHNREFEITDFEITRVDCIWQIHYFYDFHCLAYKICDRVKTQYPWIGRLTLLTNKLYIKKIPRTY